MEHIKIAKVATKEDGLWINAGMSKEHSCCVCHSTRRGAYRAEFSRGGMTYGMSFCYKHLDQQEAEARRQEVR